MIHQLPTVLLLEIAIKEGLHKDIGVLLSRLYIHADRTHSE